MAVRIGINGFGRIGRLVLPTPNVSMVSLDLNLQARATAPQINEAMKAAGQRRLRGVLDYSIEEPVSVDFNHHPASCIFDATQTRVVDEELAHVIGWYDNEWGFSCRMLDTAVLFGSL
jgi:glyceraldehyde 3-phosphate dehydrogenase (phosphorylating)